MLLKASLSLFQPFERGLLWKNYGCDLNVAIELQQVKNKCPFHLRHFWDKSSSWLATSYLGCSKGHSCQSTEISPVAMLLHGSDSAGCCWLDTCCLAFSTLSGQALRKQLVNAFCLFHIWTCKDLLKLRASLVLQSKPSPQRQNVCPCGQNHKRLDTCLSLSLVYKYSHPVLSIT